MFRNFLFALTAAMLAGVAYGAQPAPPLNSLSVTFAKTTITAAGVTPGGRVVLFGISREVTRQAPKIVRRQETLTDSDQDGAVTLTLPAGVPHRAIWVIVDLTSGRYAVLPTASYDNPPTPLTADRIRNDNNGQLRKLEIPFTEAQIIFVRPGVGAWWMEGAKDSAVDENKGAPSGIRLDIGRMQAIADAPPPPNSFHNGDILAFIDPRWMTYSSLEVGQ